MRIRVRESPLTNPAQYYILPHPHEHTYIKCKTNTTNTISLNTTQHDPLQVRLCTLCNTAAAYDTITLTERFLADADSVLNYLKLATKQDFLSRTIPADTAKKVTF